METASASSSSSSSSSSSLHARKSLPFIMPDASGEAFVIHDEACSILEKIDVPIVPVAICGRARTGKSYLLNSLIGSLSGHRTQVFRIGATVETCTKGIWLFNEPIAVELEDGTAAAIVVLDTEGFGDTDKGEDYDTRVFALATLLCSVLVYNSVGVINNDVLASLGFVAKLSQHIQTRTDEEQGQTGSASDPEEIAALCPSFVWVLRDFHLMLVDADGLELTPRDYMEQRLADDGRLDEESRRRNGVRRAIRTYFRQRDCHALMLPVEEEEQLQRLPELPDSALRPGFVEGRDALASKLRGPPLLRPKVMHGNRVTGRMLASMARAYVAAVNDDGVPAVGSAWDAAVATERRAAEAEAKQAAQAAHTAVTARLPLQDDAAEREAIAGVRQAAVSAFASRAVGGVGRDGLPASTHKAVEELVGRLVSENEAAATSHSRAVLCELEEAVLAPVFDAQRAGEREAGPGEEEVQQLRQSFIQRSRGPARVVWREEAQFWAEALPGAVSVAMDASRARAEAEAAGLRARALDAEAKLRVAEETAAAARSKAEAAAARADAAEVGEQQAKAEAEAASSAATKARREAAAARGVCEDAEARAAAAERAVFEERSRRQEAEARAEHAEEEQRAAAAAAAVAVQAGDDDDDDAQSGSEPGRRVAAQAAAAVRGSSDRSRGRRMRPPPLRSAAGMGVGAPADAYAMDGEGNGTSSGGCCTVV